MRTGLFAVATGAFVVAMLGVTVRADDDGGHRTVFRARLRSTSQAPANFTAGKGRFHLKINDATATIDFTLTYSDVADTPAAAHVHLGQRNVNGGVAFFLCGGGSKPACPAAPATITGTVVAADIVGPTDQGVAAGDFATVAAAIREGLAYANVHTTPFPAGEIRGQLE
jgi:hypothetical protein